MKTRSLINIIPALLLASTPFLSRAAVQVWDPDGTTAGTGVSGNWDLTSPNWTTAPDAGGNTMWTQGNDASFNMASNYTVTAAQPITVGNITLSGSAGTLTIAGDSVNKLTLAASSTLNTGGRGINLSAPIDGGFDLTRSGGGTVTISGASTYSGGTTLTAGTTAIAVDTVLSGGGISSSAFGTGGVTNTAAVTINTSGGARVLANPFTLNANLTLGGSTALTVTNGVWTLTAGRTVTVTNTAGTTFFSQLADLTTNTLTKAGASKLTMAVPAASTFFGGITASAGVLAAGSSTPFPTNNNNQITINGSTLDLNGFDVRLSRLGGNTAGSVLLGANTLTAGNDSSSAEFSGVISGTGGYVKVGAISQVLSGTNTFTGGITITAGSLYLPTNGTSGSPYALGAGTNTITITGTGRIGANRASPSISIVTNRVIVNTLTAGLDAASGGDFILAGQITGPGGFVRTTQGSGFTVLAASNTFAGGVELDARPFGMGNKNALGTGPFVIGHPTTAPGNAIELGSYNIDLVGSDAITNPVTINQDFAYGTRTAYAAFGLELSGPVTLAARTNGILVTGTGLFKISGVISGNGGIEKAGDNTLVLSAQNIYSGPTIVDFGTLTLTNSASVASSDIIVSSGATLDVMGRTDGTLTVGASQTLRGSGTVAGNVNVAGTLSPGQSPGALTVNGNVTLANKALFEIDKTQSPANDILIVGGTLTGGGTLTVTNSGTTLLTNNDTFNLFSQPVSGFTTVKLPVGYTWDNQLGTSGSITVISRNWPLTPTNTVATVNGGNITVSWPPNYAGGWVLDTSTNLVDWDMVPGSRDSSSVTLPTSTAPASFYRMRLLTD